MFTIDTSRWIGWFTDELKKAGLVHYYDGTSYTVADMDIMVPSEHVVYKLSRRKILAFIPKTNMDIVARVLSEPRMSILDSDSGITHLSYNGLKIEVVDTTYRSTIQCIADRFKTEFGEEATVS